MKTGVARLRLALVHGRNSVEPMKLAEAAEGVADLVWLVDLGDPRLGEQESRLIPRLGSVVDVTGLDPDQMARRLSELGPDGIMTLVDEQMVTTAMIAERLSLPFYEPRTARALSNKLVQRERLNAAGIPVPRFCAIPAGARGSEADRLAEQVGFPAVVKPQVGTASIGVRSVTDAADLRQVLGAGAACSGPLLLEERLEDARSRRAPDGAPGGDDGGVSDCVAVESVVAGGEFCHLSVAGRFRLEEPFRSTGSFVPSDIGPADLEQVTDVTEQAARALGVKRGWLNTDVKLTPSGPRVVEVNGRVGGNVPELFELLEGPHLLSMAMLLALGQDPPVRGMLEFERVAYYLWVQPPMGATRLVSVDGLEQVTALSGVTRVRRNRAPGDLLDWREGSNGHVLAVYGTTEDHACLRRVRRSIEDRISVTYDFEDAKDDV